MTGSFSFEKFLAVRLALSVSFFEVAPICTDAFSGNQGLRYRQ